jgi:hypothetical protein
MADREHLTWERFRDLIDAGPPAVERVMGSPIVEIFTDAGGTRIGVRTPSPDLPEFAPLVSMELRRRYLEIGECLEVSTANRSLFRDFYSFACSLADRIQIEKLGASDAVEQSLEAWAAVVEQEAVLSPERQLGLLGELWLLERLAESQGWERAVESWKGSEAEEHDFSWGDVDVEVKTTTSEKRIHVIGSLTQLEASPSRRLYLLSLQLTAAGSLEGTDLASTVRSIQARLSSTAPTSLAAFEAALAAVGYREEHEALYRRRLHLRTEPLLVPVDEHCPRLTRSMVDALGAPWTDRIQHDVRYRVDVSGLGAPDGTSEFAAVIPKSK